MNSKWDTAQKQLAFLATLFFVLWILALLN